MLRKGGFYPLIPQPRSAERSTELTPKSHVDAFSPVSGEKERNYSSVQNVQIDPVPRPWGRGVDVSRLPSRRERLGVGERLCA